MKRIAALLPLLMLAMLATLTMTGARAAVVTVYTSANFAPLMLADGRGVYADLVDWLNRQQLHGLTFRLQYMPRKRLQVKLEDGSLDGVVIGLMPEWVNDPGQKKYLWSVPFAADRYALVSTTARPMHPDKPRTLAGATLGVTMGYVYQGLEPWFARSRLQRSGAISDERNIEKLLRGRVDGVIVAESMARYFIRMQKLDSTLHLVPMPGASTERRFLVQHRDADVYAQLAPALKRLKHDPAWLRVRARYE